MNFFDKLSTIKKLPAIILAKNRDYWEFWFFLPRKASEFLRTWTRLYFNVVSCWLNPSKWFRQTFYRLPIDHHLFKQRELLDDEWFRGTWLETWVFISRLNILRRECFKKDHQLPIKNVLRQFSYLGEYITNWLSHNT